MYIHIHTIAGVCVYVCVHVFVCSISSSIPLHFPEGVCVVRVYLYTHYIHNIHTVYTHTSGCVSGVFACVCVCVREVCHLRFYPSFLRACVRIHIHILAGVCVYVCV